MRWIPSLIFDMFRRRRYEEQLRRGDAAGEQTYHHAASTAIRPAVVEVCVPAARIRITEAITWCARQTLPELFVAGYRADGSLAWRVTARGALLPTPSPPAPSLWLMAPGRLPEEIYPAFVESCLLIAAAEKIDAVVLRERLPALDDEPAQDATPELFLTRAWRPFTLFSERAYRYDAVEDAVYPRGETSLVKYIPPGGVTDFPAQPAFYHRHRRGPYLSTAELGPRFSVEVRDAARRAQRRPISDSRPAVLVTVPFLARGGAEHTLFETLRYLEHRFAFTLVTLAPHRAELGDRRADFAEVTDRLFCLGDLVHPAAMPGMLEALLDATGAKIWYNANSTTLFYDFAPQLKARRPDLRIIDHLYDHRVGYIERYEGDLRASIDICVAENQRIAEVLCDERGWPRSRVPVIWPCGRRRDAYPRPAQAAEIRRALRRELGFDDNDLILLCAARMHAQKRPLDLVALADRLRDLPRLHILLVGGGDLEGDVDEVIAEKPDANIRRLPFRQDIPRLILAADFGALVSAYEGLPVFMLECLQAGRPFIGTDVGDMGTVLRRTGAGLVIDKPGDLDALEQAVRQLYDPDLRAQLATEARQAGQAFAVETCAERYADVFFGRELV